LSARRKRFLRRAFAALLTSGAATMIGLAAVSCRRSTVAASAQKTSPALSRSADCRSCHEEIFAAWAASDHAHALRAVDATRDADAFTPAREFVLHAIRYAAAWREGSADFTETRPGAATEHYTATLVLGHKPLRQYLVMTGAGRYQATELAFDPARKEWFNVFGDEQRQPGEWGHWRGRGMNWNSMCAHCHTTDFRKNYDAATDAYASTWREPGIGCAQCHGELAPDHAPHATRAKSDPPSPAARQRAQETCAPCHARNELLTGDVRPGLPYSDHYRLTLPTDAAIFYPDGQMRDEDFNWTSFLTSRMGGKARVTCLDCHDPHSGKTKLPADNNALCLQCHAAAAPQKDAPPIDPTAHSHHAADSAGNRCIECHMPTTIFMQRDPRHDHGFLKPDPLLTKELGIPNTCQRCHAGQPLDGQIAAVDRWYGAKMESRQRDRARAVAAAQTWQGAGASPAPRLLALLPTEEIPAWRATLLTLTRNFAATEPAVVDAARRALTDPDPIVRAAAVQVLNASPARATLAPALKDSSRLVRLDAEWALSERLEENSPARRELDAYLAANADQPTGQLRLAQDFFNRGRTADAESALHRAIAWDPNFAAAHAALGNVLNALDRPAESAAAFWRAAQLAPADAASAFDAALAFAGAQKLPDAELALRETLRRDPHHDRAWYNLGLLLAQTSREAEGIAALRHAESIAPTIADYPYARATIHWRRSERDEARTAAQRALELDPRHAGARTLLDAAR